MNEIEKQNKVINEYRVRIFDAVPGVENFLAWAGEFHILSRFGSGELIPVRGL